MYSKILFYKDFGQEKVLVVDQKSQMGLGVDDVILIG